jgi:CDP-diacylglycerol---serine O-phosphatidyltransferase
MGGAGLLLGGALVSAPWPTLSIVVIGYLLTIPFSVRAYARIRRQRATGAWPPVRPPASDPQT